MCCSHHRSHTHVPHHVPRASLLVGDHLHRTHSSLCLPPRDRLFTGFPESHNVVWSSLPSQRSSVPLEFQTSEELLHSCSAGNHPHALSWGFLCAVRAVCFLYFLKLHSNFLPRRFCSFSHSYQGGPSSSHYHSVVLHKYGDPRARPQVVRSTVWGSCAVRCSATDPFGEKTISTSLQLPTWQSPTPCHRSRWTRTNSDPKDVGSRWFVLHADERGAHLGRRSLSLYIDCRFRLRHSLDRYRSYVYDLSPHRFFVLFTEPAHRPLVSASPYHLHVVVLPRHHCNPLPPYIPQPCLPMGLLPLLHVLSLLLLGCLHVDSLLLCQKVGHSQGWNAVQNDRLVDAES